jgi:phage terminase large subunit-like protein
MVRRSPEIRRRYGVEALANAIWQERTSSQFRPISSDAKALDGLNVQIAVYDEIASHKTSEVYDVLLTAMGKRRNPLLLAISTATGNNTGVGKQLWDYAVRVLDGTQADERLFALIYTIDPEDDPWEEASWIKANPSWGQAVQPEAIRAIMRQARNNPAQEAAAKSRHLNIWVAADEALFSMHAPIHPSASRTSKANNVTWRWMLRAARILRRWPSRFRPRSVRPGRRATPLLRVAT